MCRIELRDAMTLWEHFFLVLLVSRNLFGALSQLTPRRIRQYQMHATAKKRDEHRTRHASPYEMQHYAQVIR